VLPPLAIWVLLSLGVGFLGRKRSGGFLGFFAASMVFSPLVSVLFLILSRPRRFA
jgi:hypothetical protein